MVESRQMDEMADPYMYPEDGYDACLQDADILDRPDLFYPGKSCNEYRYLFTSMSDCLILDSTLFK